MDNILEKLKIDSFLELLNADLTVKKKKSYFGFYRKDILNILGFDVANKKNTVYEMGLFTDNRPYMMDSKGVSAIMKTFVALLVREIVDKSKPIEPLKIEEYLSEEVKEIVLYSNIDPLELAMLNDSVKAEKFRYTKNESIKVEYKGAIYLYDCLQYSMKNAISISVDDYKKARDALKQGYNSYDNALVIYKDMRWNY